MIAHATSPRVVLAKIGLDGHDRGVKVVARGLRDAGFHVIYAGLWQPIEAVVQTVLDEDADWLGISLLSDAHMTLIPPLMDKLRQNGLARAWACSSAASSRKDVPKLLELGVRSVAGPGTTIPEIVERMHKPEEHPSVEDLIRRFREKDRRGLARLLTLASRGEALDALRHELAERPKTCRVAAFTGSGGVGKSSLIGRLGRAVARGNGPWPCSAAIRKARSRAVCSLGDRLRIAKPADDASVFIRSLATPGGQQAIAKNLDVMMALLAAYGFDTVILETVGAGQGTRPSASKATCWWSCCSPNRATSCNGKRPACSKWPTSS